MAPANKLYPREDNKTTVYLKNAVTRKNIIVGDYTIYHDFNDPLAFEKQNVLYHYPCNPEKLIIGKFSSVACAAQLSNRPFPSERKTTSQRAQNSLQ